MYKILIVDDDKIIRAGLKVIIESNYDDCEAIIQAANGRIALEILQSDAIDIMITDVRMPVMDGVELIKKVRECSLNVKSIVLSGFDEYKYVRETLKNGACDYLLKPIQNEELLKTLDKVKAEIKSERQMKEQLDSYHWKLNKSLPVLKENFLVNLIKTGSIQVETFLEKQRELGIPDIGSYTMVLISIDDLYKIKMSISANEDASALNMLKYITDSVFSSEGHEETIISIICENRILLMIYTLEEYSSRLHENVIKCLDKVKEKIMHEINFTVSMGVSEVNNYINNAHIAYKQAKLALEKRFYMGKNNIITYNPDVCCYSSAGLGQFKDKMDDLIISVDLGKTSEVKKKSEVIFDEIMKMNLSPDLFRDLLIKLVHIADSVSQEFSNASLGYPSEEFDIVFYIEEINTAAELKKYFADMFVELTERINTERAERSIKIIEIAKEYIRKHYKEDISLKSVADYVHLNPNYFSELFKKQEGKNFMDFIIETKVNEAKRLLCDPSIKVYEVGHLVGYEEPASFNRAFKKLIGVSPSQYRNIVK
ncbi:MAG: response regulator [Clostridia bacterium]|nr:response regulator [Clostridia bacterium]